jgi:transcriptional regulator with XRE-family HTH domain
MEERIMDEDTLLERLRAKRSLPPGDERRRIREAAGASLRDVAREIGTSTTSVIRWERGGSPGRHTATYARLLDELQRLGP